MKFIKKKILVVFMACLMLCMTFSIPVLAATNTFSKSIRLSTTGKTCFSFGSISGENILITQVKIYLNVASGTDAFDIYI